MFLPDYGMAMAQKLYPGCDIWLNNPLRPLEACGTSGMKAALNGCLNLSVLDGWWDEWFQPDFGWAIPTADGTATDDDRRDDLEAAALYDLLEQRVAPRFYERGQAGLPDRWIEMVRQTLTHLGPKVLAGPHGPRVRGTPVRPRGPRPPRPHPGHGTRAGHLEVPRPRGLAACHRRPRGGASATTTAELGTTLSLRVRVGLGDLGPDDVEVQAVAGRVDSDDRITDATTVPLKPAGGPDLEGRWAVRGSAVPGPDGALRLYGPHPARASTAGVERGVGVGGGSFGGTGGGGGGVDAVRCAAGGSAGVCASGCDGLDAVSDRRVVGSV